MESLTAPDDLPRDNVASVRAENLSWFALLDDLRLELAQACKIAVGTVDGSVWDPNVVTVRILLRAFGQAEAASLLIERGMVVEAGASVRGLTECAFAVAAIRDKPRDYIELLRQDMQASTKNRGKFALEQNIVTNKQQRETLQRKIEIVQKARLATQKKISELGQLPKLYLGYQILSDKYAHATARALHFYVETKDTSPPSAQYRVARGNAQEVAEIMIHLMLAGLGVGFIATEVLKLPQQNINFQRLGERLGPLHEAYNRQHQSAVA